MADPFMDMRKALAPLAAADGYMGDAADIASHAEAFYEWLREAYPQWQDPHWKAIPAEWLSAMFNAFLGGREHYRDGLDYHSW